MAPEIEFASSNFPPSHKTASYAGYDMSGEECQNHAIVHSRLEKSCYAEKKDHESSCLFNRRASTLEYAHQNYGGRGAILTIYSGNHQW